MANEIITNTYTRLDDETTILVINYNDEKRIEIKVDTKYFENIKKYLWNFSFSSTNKYGKNYFLVWTRFKEKLRKTSRSLKSMSMRKFIMGLSLGLDMTKDYDFTVVQKNIEDFTNFKESNLHLVSLKNVYSPNIEAKQKLEKGLKSRYNKEWSNRLKTQPSTQKITMKMATEIRELYTNHSQEELSKTYNVARTTITDVINYRSCNPYSYKDILKEEIAEIENVLTINLDVNYTRKSLVDLNKYQLLNYPYLIFKFDGHTVYYMTINDFQFYMEYYYNDVFIGSTQHCIENPLRKSSKRAKNNQITKLNKDSFGYAKDKNVVLTKDKIYAIINAIQNYLNNI